MLAGYIKGDTNNIEYSLLLSFIYYIDNLYNLCEYKNAM